MLDVHAPDGVQRVRRRASAYYRWCAELWGRAQPPRKRDDHPALLTTVSAFPDGGPNDWDAVHELESDRGWIEGLEAIAARLVPTAPDEAVLLLRRHYEVDHHFGPDRSLFSRDEEERTAPAAIARQVTARSKVTPLSQFRRETTPAAAVKRVLPFARAKSERDRLAVAMTIVEALPNLSYGNHLTFHALFAEALPHLLAPGDGAVHEVALGLAQSFAMKLVRRGAYAEAKPLLDLVIDHHIALPEALRARYEAGLYLDALAGEDPARAEEDWARAAKLGGGDDTPTSMGPCLFWRGDVRDRKNVILARVAEALAKRVKGVYACGDRKLGKKDALSPDVAKRILARAKVLSGEAVDIGDARKGPAVRDRGFQVEQYTARAEVRAAAGDRKGALADLEAARELAVATGRSSKVDPIGEDVRELRRQIANEKAPAIPPAFEPKWLTAKTRTSAERDAAVRAWARGPSKVFPKTPAQATKTPMAYVLLRDVLSESVTFWKIAAKDGVDLGDRVAFGKRAVQLLDEWADRREASRLEDVLPDAWRIAFFDRDTDLSDVTKKDREPFWAWLTPLATAKRIDAGTVLAGLDGKPWKALGAKWADGIDLVDPPRALFEALCETGQSGDAITAVVAAYADLFEASWTFGTPTRGAARFTKHGPALEALDAHELAPAIARWTRAYMKLPRYDSFGFCEPKWMWPFYWLWSEGACRPLLADYAAGALDRKKVSRAQASSRAECVAWLEARWPVSGRRTPSPSAARSRPASPARSR